MPLDTESSSVRAISTPDTPLVLLADDREVARDLIATELEEVGCQVVQAADGLHAWEKFQTYQFDLVISDVRMPRSDGMSLLRRICSAHSPNPKVPVLLVSAFGDLSTAAEAGRAGAVDFFPFNDSGIEGLIERATEILEREEPLLPPCLLGESIEAGRLRERVEAFAPLDAPVLVCGERGSGCESIARYVHRKSRYSALPFVVITAETASSMLSRVPQGTVYLQSVENFSPVDQSSWLERVKEADALGASASMRVLASSGEHLSALISDGVVSQDAGRLLARFEIDVPPLSRRTQDLLAIVEELHHRVLQRLGRRETFYTDGALEALTAHRWRKLDDLEAAIESLIVCAPKGKITPSLVSGALAELSAPLDRIDEERWRAERKQLIELYRRHGTYSGVARELGITRNAAKYRLAKHELLPPAGRTR